MSGVTHLPEVQCIDISAILASLGAKEIVETDLGPDPGPEAEHKAVPSSSGSGSSTDDCDGDGSCVEESGSGSGSGEGTESNSGTTSATHSSPTVLPDRPLPVVCLVLATDGVW